METIRITPENLVNFYGNRAGFVKGKTAYIDAMFDRAELRSILKEKYSLETQIEEGLYDRLISGDMIEAETLKRCRIYQLKPDVNVRMKFISLKDLQKLGFGKPNPDNYIIVFDGNIGSSEPDEIYTKLTTENSVESYAGHVMAISDVIELYDDSGSIFYYVDKGGYPIIDFYRSSSEQRMENETKEFDCQHNEMTEDDSTEPTGYTDEKTVFKFTM